MSKDKPTLANDYNARPAQYRAADFGGRDGRLVVDGEYASDSYVMVPASSVSTSSKNGATAKDLAPGKYEVKKLDAAPELLSGEPPNMTSLIPTGNRVELVPFEIDGIGHVHVLSGEMVVAVFTTADGVKVGIDKDKLPIDGAVHESFGGYVNHHSIRWSMTADADKPALRPVVFTRRKESRDSYADGKDHAPRVNEWQALIMPVKLPGR